jgi:hypothetical protein
VYWKPIYYGLEGLVAELWLVNAMHVKRVPGRKTDVSDAEWLARCATGATYTTPRPATSSRAPRGRTPSSIASTAAPATSS